jgi:ketosteroid isomerase-like protein
MKKCLAVLALGCSLLVSVVAAQNAPEDPVHSELRALRVELVDAVSKGDIDSVLNHLSPDVVVTWQNAEVCRGRQGVRDFFQRMGKQSFKGYKVPPTPDDLTIMYNGDTGLSFGSSVGRFNVLGKEFDFHNRWTATVVKENGRWLVASYHVSWNALDNPLLAGAEAGIYWAGGIALVIGLAVGLLVGRRHPRPLNG